VLRDAGTKGIRLYSFPGGKQGKFPLGNAEVFVSWYELCNRKCTFHAAHRAVTYSYFCAMRGRQESELDGFAMARALVS
jgi:hypothetical protein